MLQGAKLLSNKTCYRFGAFRLYPTEQRLLREQTPIALAPKTFEVLLYLVKHSGSLVRREELMEAVWPDSFVEETNLNVNISLLRKTLGSLPDGQPFIETVPRKGYRFHGQVTEDEEGPAQLSETSAPAHQESQLSPAVGAAAMAAAATAAARTPPVAQVTSPEAVPAPPLSPQSLWRVSLPKVIALSLVLLVVFLGVIFTLSRLRAKTSTVNASTRSIAILPFRGLSPNANDEYLGLE